MDSLAFGAPRRECFVRHRPTALGGGDHWQRRIDFAMGAGPHYRDLIHQCGRGVSRPPILGAAGDASTPLPRNVS